MFPFIVLVRLGNINVCLPLVHVQWFIRLFPGLTLVYHVILDCLQLCYLYGQSVRQLSLVVMVEETVVYMEHISSHLGNNLSEEFSRPPL